MQLKNNYIIREIMGDTLLIPDGEHLFEFNGIITLNELGVFILKLLPDVESEDEIVKNILEEYEVDEATAKKDVCDFMEQLRAIKII
ncbi:MAG: PqqD family protein [Clostridia bacterium]|nr:PqqD family protein [Clostridia bacterium]